MSNFPLRDAAEAAHRARVEAAKARGGRILSIVAYPGGLCSWVGETERVRVRNFDPVLGAANVLTEADIVDVGGTEIVVLKR